MTVKELIKELEAMPQDLPVALEVYGHTYSSVDNKLSHGPLAVYVGENNYNNPHVFLQNHCLACLTRK